jgi:hypothetical protein
MHHLRLLDAVAAHLLPHLAVLGDRAVAVRLLTFGDPLLGLGMAPAHLRPRSHLPLLLMHLGVLRALRPLHREPLRTLLHPRHFHALGMLLETWRLHPLCALLKLRTLHARRGEAAAVATATTAAVHERGMATATAAMVAAAVPVRSCIRRGRDRQRSNAGREKHPGHEKISFRTAKTARSWHRSNA